MEQVKFPFEPGQRYRVRSDYKFLNHSFRAGEIVVFKAFGYSVKEGLTRYWFTRDDDSETNAWHVDDEQRQEIHWHDMFEICTA
jgi:hypothetical protein